MDYSEKLIKKRFWLIFLFVSQMSGDSGISGFPEEDNIFSWKGTTKGSKDTVFDGTEYKLSLSFPSDYPFKPPTVKFETTCYHPNVDMLGNICLDILQVIKLTLISHFLHQYLLSIAHWFIIIMMFVLQDKWSSVYDVRTILLSIQSLLGGK